MARPLRTTRLRRRSGDSTSTSGRAPVLRAQGVDDGVLDPLRGVARVGDGAAGDVRVDGEGVAGREMRASSRSRPRRRTARARRRSRTRRSATARGWPAATTAPRAGRRAGCPRRWRRRWWRWRARSRARPARRPAGIPGPCRRRRRISWRHSAASSAANASALACTWSDRRWSSSTSSRRARRALRPVDHLRGRDQLVVPAVDDRGRHAGGLHRRRAASITHRRRHQEQAGDRHLPATRGR